MVSGILKAGSECSTLVPGNPAMYAERKIAMKTAPTPCVAYRTVLTCFWVNCTFLLPQLII